MNRSLRLLVRGLSSAALRSNLLGYLGSFEGNYNYNLLITEIHCLGRELCKQPFHRRRIPLRHFPEEQIPKTTQAPLHLVLAGHGNVDSLWQLKKKRRLVGTYPLSPSSNSSGLNSSTCTGFKEQENQKAQCPCAGEISPSPFW